MCFCNKQQWCAFVDSFILIKPSIVPIYEINWIPHAFEQTDEWINQELANGSPFSCARSFCCVRNSSGGITVVWWQERASADALTSLPHAANCDALCVLTPVITSTGFFPRCPLSTATLKPPGAFIMIYVYLSKKHREMAVTSDRFI